MMVPHWFIILLKNQFYKRYRNSLKTINPPYKVEFSEVPKEWICKICWGDLTWVWRKSGIKATGISGFICGERDFNGCSSLWNPKSPNYLAWCGIYIYKPDNFEDFYHKETGVTELARNIGYKDDMSWSKIYGNKKPYYEEISIKQLKEPLISCPLNGYSYFSTVRCQTYLGPKSYRFKARIASQVLIALYKDTSQISLPTNFFLPSPQLCDGHSYENVLRDVWVHFIPLPDKNLIYVIYATSVRAEDGTWNYSKILEPEFYRFFKGIKISSL